MYFHSSLGYFLYLYTRNTMEIVDRLHYSANNKKKSCAQLSTHSSGVFSHCSWPGTQVETSWKQDHDKEDHQCCLTPLLCYTENSQVHRDGGSVDCQEPGKEGQEVILQQRKCEWCWDSLISVHSFIFWLLAFFLCSWYNFRSINILLKLFLC